MNIRGAGAVLCLTAGVASGCAAQATPREALLVLSKQAQTLAIVDPATLAVVARVPVGDDPHEVIAAPDGRTAYVSNYGFGRYHALARVDLVAQKALPAVDTGALRGPHGLGLDGDKVWFTAEAAKAVARFDPATGAVDAIVGTGQNRTHLLRVLRGGRRIVATNVNSGTVTVLDRLEVEGGVPKPGAPALPGLPEGAILPPGGDWLETVIPVGVRDEGFDVAPDEREAWVGNAGDGTISVIDLEMKKVTATIRADVPTVNRVKFTPDGRRVLVSQMHGPEITVLDSATRKVTARVRIGQDGAGILMEPDGKRAFAASPTDGDVAVIDLKTLKVVGRIDAGPNPDGMAWVVRR